MNFKVVCVYMSKNICEGFSWEREILFFFFFIMTDDMLLVMEYVQVTAQKVDIILD